MKPLPSAPFTQEDYAVIGHRAVYGLLKHHLCILDVSIVCDRRDATLMLDAQINPGKILIGPLTVPPWEWIRVRGGQSFGDFLREEFL